MRVSLEYKSPRYRKTIGFMKLDTSEYSLDLRIIRSCNRYQPIVKELYQDVLKILEKHYKVVDSNFNVHKINNLQNSRLKKARRIKNESR